MQDNQETAVSNFESKVGVVKSYIASGGQGKLPDGWKVLYHLSKASSTSEYVATSVFVGFVAFVLAFMIALTALSTPNNVNFSPAIVLASVSGVFGGVAWLLVSLVYREKPKEAEFFAILPDRILFSSNLQGKYSEVLFAFYGQVEIVQDGETHLVHFVNIDGGPLWILPSFWNEGMYALIRMFDAYKRDQALKAQMQ